MTDPELGDKLSLLLLIQPILWKINWESIFLSKMYTVDTGTWYHPRDVKICRDWAFVATNSDHSYAGTIPCAKYPQLVSE